VTSRLEQPRPAGRRAEALAELDRAKTAFFSNVSHEFRNPLTLMRGPAQEVLQGVHGPLARRVQAEVSTIQRNGLRLLKLVNSLLDLARIEAGRAEHHPRQGRAWTSGSP
jgi:signal transduction histidine kinase